MIYKFYESVLTIATNIDHPLNADSLHKYLKQFGMPERDSLWSIFLHYHYGKHSAVDRLVEWAWLGGDKTHINDFTEKYRKLIEFLKNRPISKPPENNDIKYENNDLIIWHILYKRKIENYIPLCILFDKVKQITETQKHELKNTAKDDLDFIEYDYYNIGIGETIIKKEFPEMFLGDFSYRELEQRCEHHKVFLPEANESVSELEQILLKIAKLI